MITRACPLEIDRIVGAWAPAVDRHLTRPSRRYPASAAPLDGGAAGALRRPDTIRGSA
jgi:hypothetical protein